MIFNQNYYERFVKWLTPERAQSIESLCTWALAPLIVPPLVALASKPGEKINNFSRDFSRYLVGTFDYFVVGSVSKRLYQALGVKQPSLVKLLGFLTAFAVNEAYYGYFSIKLAQQCSDKYNLFKYYRNMKNKHLSQDSPPLPQLSPTKKDAIQPGISKYQTVYKHFDSGLSI